MRKLQLLIMILSIIFTTNIFAQSNNKTKTNKPKVDIKVKIKRDENGNIIAYDSTYTETYSSSNVKNINVDSLMAEFNRKFENISGFNNNCFSGFADIQKQIQSLSAMPNFFPDDSLMLEFPKIPDFSEFDNFFDNNKSDNIITPESKQQQNKPAKKTKPKLNPVNTYQF